jgi:hypothetical protein
LFIILYPLKTWFPSIASLDRDYSQKTENRGRQDAIRTQQLPNFPAEPPPSSVCLAPPSPMLAPLNWLLTLLSSQRNDQHHLIEPSEYIFYTINLKAPFALFIFQKYSTSGDESKIDNPQQWLLLWTN